MKHRPAGMPPDTAASPIKAGVATLMCVGLECVLLVMLFSVFTENIGLLPNVYLSEQPGVGWLFAAIDEDLSVSHLVAFMLAFVSCAVPVFIWSEVLSQRIYERPQAWLAEPGHQIAAVFAVAVLAIVVALEVVNFYTLIAKQSAAGPLAVTGQSELMAFLADNKALGIIVSVLMAVVNVVIGFFTARAAHDLKTALREAGL
jgi:hypothetical protein